MGPFRITEKKVNSTAQAGRQNSVTLGVEKQAKPEGVKETRLVQNCECGFTILRMNTLFYMKKSNFLVLLWNW